MSKYIKDVDNYPKDHKMYFVPIFMLIKFDIVAIKY